MYFSLLFPSREKEREKINVTGEIWQITWWRGQAVAPNTKVTFSSLGSVQFLCSVVSDSSTPWTTARQASLSTPTPGVDQTHFHWVGDTIQPSHPLCPLLLPPSIFPNIRLFAKESVLHTSWPKYWNFSFNISPSNEHSGLISFRMDWLDLLVVQGTLKSLLQHHSSKASIIWHSPFFRVQLSHLYMTTEKTIALTRKTFVGKLMSDRKSTLNSSHNA